MRSSILTTCCFIGAYVLSAPLSALATPNTVTPSPKFIKKVLSNSSTDSAFPYGEAPSDDVCVTSVYYATPEGLLGSWSMQQAIKTDKNNGELPDFMNSDNTAYVLGTAAIGDQLGMKDANGNYYCSGGCNELNGQCFALQFNGSKKPNVPYVIFQSVNIGANPNSFDFYLPGGGSGAFPDECREFWGTSTASGQHPLKSSTMNKKVKRKIVNATDTVDWAAHIEDFSSCEAYFNNFNTINAPYSVTYNGEQHTAKDTLEEACHYSYDTTKLSTANWEDLTVVPVTCPKALTQISGIELSSSVTKAGNVPLVTLSQLKESDFSASSITNVTTTQMQDCRTPSSGYCNNNNSNEREPNYLSSISADLNEPLLSGGSLPPDSTYCESNPSTSFCSWNNGQDDGGDYCNQSQSTCYACGNSPQWCTCDAEGELVSCVSQGEFKVKSNIAKKKIKTTVKQKNTPAPGDVNKPYL